MEMPAENTVGNEETLNVRVSAQQSLKLQKKRVKQTPLPSGSKTAKRRKVTEEPGWRENREIKTHHETQK